MKKYILVVIIVTALFGCDSKEKAALRYKVDSLNVQLTASRKTEEKMNEVAVLIDSIDASRNMLKVKMIEGRTYGEYVTRLQEINTYVRETQAKLNELEKSSKKSSKSTTAAIRRLKADLEKRSQEIVDLQLQLANARNENTKLWARVNEKDSILSIRDQVIKLNESDIASLEKLVNDTQIENKVTVGNLYFAQAAALELAANRTHFAPRKKKETRREALELYRLSLSLGNENAQAKINDLEKKLS